MRVLPHPLLHVERGQASGDAQPNAPSSDADIDLEVVRFPLQKRLAARSSAGAGSAWADTVVAAAFWAGATSPPVIPDPQTTAPHAMKRRKNGLGTMTDGTGRSLSVGIGRSEHGHTPLTHKHSRRRCRRCKTGFSSAILESYKSVGIDRSVSVGQYRLVGIDRS